MKRTGIAGRGKLTKANDLAKHYLDWLVTSL